MRLPYSEEAKNAIEYSEEVARLWDTWYITTQHLLVALIERSERVREVINKLGARPLELRGGLFSKLGAIQEKTLGPEVVVVEGPKANRALYLAKEEASMRGNKEVGPESILLGILRDESASATQFLYKRNITYASAQRAVTELYPPSLVPRPWN